MLESACLATLLGFFAFFAVWEAGSPRWSFVDPATRWLHIARNVGLFVVLLIVTGLLLNGVLPRMAPFFPELPQGLISGLGLSLPVQVIFGVLVLDLCEYAFHRFCHHNRWLWRLHQVHHADAHLDVSTGMRFHPLESALSLIVKLALLAVLGLPLWIEAVRVLVTNPMAFAQHANVKFPDWLERWGHLVIITPALHRVHHSTDPADHDQNFGELFCWWDRLFATYRTPSGEVTVGLPGFEDRRWQTLTGMLAMPWSAPQVPARA